MRTLHYANVLFCCLAFCAVFPALFACGVEADEEAIQLSELAFGRWAILFLSDEQPNTSQFALATFSRASIAFPELTFLAIVRDADTLEAASETPTGDMSILVDPDGALAHSLDLFQYPVCLICVDGVFINELMWPFQDAQLMRALAESLLVVIRFPDPSELLGQQAPGFAFEIEGKSLIAPIDLSFPILLVFINPDCQPCLDYLPQSSEIPMAVDILVLLATGGDSTKDVQLDQFERLRLSLGTNRTSIAVTSRETLVSYHIARSPSLVLIDEDGMITWVAHGSVNSEIESDDFAAAIEGLHDPDD